MRAARLDVGGIEYLETPDGRRVFYDINANSNLRPSVAAAFGFDPFERVVDYLERQLTSPAHTVVRLQTRRRQTTQPDRTQSSSSSRIWRGPCNDEWQGSNR